MPSIQAFFDPATGTVTYLVWDPATQEAAIIDPILDYDPASGALLPKSVGRVFKVVDELGLTIIWALDTHAHADHFSALDYIRTETGAKIGIGSRIVEVQKIFAPLYNAGKISLGEPVFDRLFDDGEEFALGGIEVKVMHTPGHTSACVTYIIEDAAFVGDTLFMPDFGTARTDFPGGDAVTLYRSIQSILSLSDETRIFVGHDYPPVARGEPAWETSVAAQKSANLHLRGGVSEAEFVEMRTKKDATLSPPKLILPSLQVNIRAGALPPKEDDGHAYLKIPINRMG